MAIAQILFGLFLGQISDLGLLLVASHRQHAINQTVAFLNGQPLLTQEIGAFACLQIVHNDVLEEPGGVGSFARIVVPHS